MSQSQDLSMVEKIDLNALQCEVGSRDKHILIIQDNQGQREIILNNSVYSVGRNPRCDIRLSSGFSSRHHATLLYMPFSEQEDCCYCIVDGNLKGKTSTNGLFVNGKKVKSKDLQDGDELVFGPDARASYHRSKFDDDNTLTSDFADVTVIGDIFNCLREGERDIAA